jgi:hypothetical protein
VEVVHALPDTAFDIGNMWKPLIHGISGPPLQSLSPAHAAGVRELMAACHMQPS